MVRALKIFFFCACLHEIHSLRPEASVDEYQRGSLATAQLKESLTSLIQAHKSGRQEDVTRLLREIASPGYNQGLKGAIEELQNTTRQYVNDEFRIIVNNLRNGIIQKVGEVEESDDNVNSSMITAAGEDADYYKSCSDEAQAAEDVTTALQAFVSAVAVTDDEDGNCSIRQETRDVKCPRDTDCNIGNLFDDPFQIACNLEGGKTTCDEHYVGTIKDDLTTIIGHFESQLTSKRTIWTPYDTDCKAELDAVVTAETNLKNKVNAWDTAVIQKDADKVPRDKAVCDLGLELQGYCKARSDYDLEKTNTENSISALKSAYDLPAMVLCLCEKMIAALEDAPDDAFAGLTDGMIEDCDNANSTDFDTDIGTIDWTSYGTRVDKVQTDVSSSLQVTDDSPAVFVCDGTTKVYFDDDKLEYEIGTDQDDVQYCNFNPPKVCGMIDEVEYPVDYVPSADSHDKYLPRGQYGTKAFILPYGDDSPWDNFQCV